MEFNGMSSGFEKKLQKMPQFVLLFRVDFILVKVATYVLELLARRS